MENPLKYFAELKYPRVERRRCSVIADLSLIEKGAEWASLQGLARIESERYHKTTGKTEREIRYSITSLRPDAARLNQAIRQHWGIESAPQAHTRRRFEVN